MTVFSGSSVRSRCVKCDHFVRSEVELGRDLADLQALLRDVQAARGSGREELDRLCGIIEAEASWELARMSAELQGVHLDCAGEAVGGHFDAWAMRTRLVNEPASRAA